MLDIALFTKPVNCQWCNLPKRKLRNYAIDQAQFFDLFQRNILENINVQICVLNIECPMRQNIKAAFFTALLQTDTQQLLSSLDRTGVLCLPGTATQPEVDLALGELSQHPGPSFTGSPHQLSFLKQTTNYFTLRAHLLKFEYFYNVRMSLDVSACLVLQGMASIFRLYM